MAVNIGPRIGVDGEKEYRDQMQKIIAETKRLGSELKALSSSYDKNSSVISQNRQKTELLNQAINKARTAQSRQNQMLDASIKKRQDLANKIKQSIDANGKETKETQALRESYNKNEIAIEKYKKAVADTSVEINKLEANLREIPNALQTIGSTMQKVGNGMTNIGKNMSMYLTTPILGLAAATVKVAADFEAQMSRVSAISGAVGDELEALSQKAAEMGETTKFTATESAQAFEYMAMAGWKTEDMLSGIEGVMSLAAASGEDLATTADIVTDDLTAFGLSASDAGHFADVLAAASSNANTNVAMMGETFQYAGPLAGAMGYSIEDMALATGLMANASIKGTQAGTSLRALFTRLSKPTKQSQKAIDELGISITDASGKMLPLNTVLTDMRTKFSELTETQKASYAAMLAGQNGMSGFLAMMNASQEDVDKLNTALANANGSAEAMAATMQDNLQGQLTLLKSELESAGRTIGEIIIPYLRKGIKTVSDVVKAFKKLNPEQKKAIVNTLGIVAALGPLLSIGGKVVSIVGSVTKGVGTLVRTIPSLVAGITAQTAATGVATGAQIALNTAMLAMPIIGIVAAIGGLVAGLSSMGDAATKARMGLDEFDQAGEDLIAQNEDLATTYSNMAEAVRSANDEEEENIAVTKNAANTIYDLADKAGKSETDIARLSVSVGQLNKLYPDLGLSIDKATGALNKSKSEINAFVDNAIKIEKINGSTKSLTAITDGLATATVKAEQAEEKYNQAVARREELVGSGERILADIEANRNAIDGLTGQYQTGILTMEEYNQKVDALVPGILNLTGGFTDLNGIENTINDTIKIADEQIAGYKEDLDMTNEVVRSYSQGAADLTVRLDSMNAAQQAATASVEADTAARGFSTEALRNEQLGIEASITNWQSLGTTVANEMSLMQSTVSQSISSQMDMFSKFDAGTAISTQTLLDNMQSQIDGVTKWEENLALLAEKGINQDLLKKLEEMGPEGSNYVTAFANMSAEEMGKANELWKEKLDIEGFGNEAGQKLTDAIGTMAAGSTEAFTALGEQLGLQAQAAGGYLGQGLIEGIQLEQPNVDAAVTTSADDVIDGYNTELGVNSPSWKTRESGKFLMQGLALGIQDGKPQVNTSLGTVITLIHTHLITKIKSMASQTQAAGRDNSIGLANGLNSGKGNVNSAMNALSTAVANGKNQIAGQRASFQSLGQNLAAGLAAGISAGQSAVVNAVVAMASAAVAAAQSSLQIQSPSKVFADEVGRFIPTGVAEGIKHNMRYVKDALIDMNDIIEAPRFIPAFASGSTSSVNNMEYGGTTINVYGAQGQDVEELADIVSERIDTQVTRMRAVWA